MTKRLFLLSLFFGLIIIIAIGCNDSGGGGDSCDGPVPCMTTDWGDTFYEFDDDGDPIVVTSDGEVFAGAAPTDDGFILGVGGEVVDCYKGNITVGGIDFNLDGIVDEWFDTASGNVKICDTKLKVTNLILDGVPYENTVADYVGVARSMIQSEECDSAQAIVFETLDRLRDE